MKRSARGDRKRVPSLANLVSFQLGWWACCIGAAHGLAWVGPLVVAVHVGLHLLWISDPRTELRVVLAVALAGCALDAGLTAAGLLRFSGDAAGAWLLPPWMIALWCNFPLVLRHSLAWMQTRPWLAAAFGLIGGPATYAGARSLGALEIWDPWTGTAGRVALVVLAVLWAVLMPILLRCVRDRA